MDTIEGIQTITCFTAI